MVDDEPDIVRWCVISPNPATRYRRLPAALKASLSLGATSHPYSAGPQLPGLSGLEVWRSCDGDSATSRIAVLMLNRPP